MRPYIPLSQRPVAQIRAQARQYQQMAATAREPVAKRGLETLAVKLTVLAQRREAAENSVQDNESNQGQQQGAAD